MRFREFGLVVAYLTLHLMASGPMNYLLYANHTRSFYDIPVALAVGTLYKILIGFAFLKAQKVQSMYFIPILLLALITRILFHGPFPIAILAGWFYLRQGSNSLTAS